MQTQPKTREQQAVCSTPAILTRGLAAFVVYFGLLSPGMLVAEMEPANQPLSATPSPQTRLTFTQQAAPAAISDSIPDRYLPKYNLPENECSAVFWDPYEAQALAIAQSPARVQQSSTAQFDPADTVQELPDEVVDPASGVQPMNNLLVQSLPRVQQLDGEVIKPSQSEEIQGERPADAPPFDPDAPLTVLEN